MELPEGIERLHIGLVCKLLKALYGLRQSSRAWYYRLDTYLVAHGFIRTTTDSNIDIRTHYKKTRLLQLGFLTPTSEKTLTLLT